MILAELGVPATTAQLRTVRLLAARVAREQGVNDETVEDIRLAVGEACVLQIGIAQQILLSIAVDQSALTVIVQSEGDASKDAVVADQELSRVMLEALVPELGELPNGLRLRWPSAA